MLYFPLNIFPSCGSRFLVIFSVLGRECGCETRWQRAEKKICM